MACKTEVIEVLRIDWSAGYRVQREFDGKDGVPAMKLVLNQDGQWVKGLGIIFESRRTADLAMRLRQTAENRWKELCVLAMHMKMVGITLPQCILNECPTLAEELKK